MTATYLRRPSAEAPAPPREFHASRVMEDCGAAGPAKGAHVAAHGRSFHVSEPPGVVRGACWSCGAPQGPQPPLCRTCGWALFGAQEASL